MAAATSCRSLLILLASLSAFLFFHATAVHTPAAAGGGARVVEPTTAATTGDGGDAAKVYIVFTERLPAAGEPSSEQDASAAVAAYHHDLIGTVLDGSSSSAPDRVVYHYSRGLHGFAARLTNEERNRLAEHDAVLSIHEKVVYRPLTTRSWDFLGLPLPPKHKSELLPFENDVIIGMVDSGIWPESQSFSDEGLPPPPAKWKGTCSSNFTCNNKIIGARAYLDGRTTLSPRDDDGHGTHTASTAAGRPVAGASLGGLAGGTARGGAPGARLAIYKVCWGDAGCSSHDLLAAFDDAIADGVDILSASLGTEVPYDYADDSLAIGAFHAMRRGVVTSVAAGNDGPALGSVSNVAPWMTVVGAVTDDRKIVSELMLGNGKRMVANSSINAFFPHLGKPALLVDPGGCEKEQLEGKRYKGAVLLCGYGMDPEAFRATGAHGAIRTSLMLELGADGNIAFSYSHPTIFLHAKDYDDIVHYYNTTTRNPIAVVRHSQTIKDASAPSVASFSSRGPNQITHGILKPDISAPGVSILAAWSGEGSVSGTNADTRRAKYNVISGTSMACPHVTGAAALVKSIHPSWSHAAVLSALVTTATPMTAASSGAAEAELAYGAGMLNPLGARYPGLVYDASEADYMAFLCAQGYNASQLATITGSAKTAAAACPAKGEAGVGVAVGGLKYPSVLGAVGDLNYPSVTVPVPVLNYGVPFAAEFPRTVTNVGPADSVYRATVTSVPGVDVTVTPDELAFSKDMKKLSFTVRVSGKLASVDGSFGASASVVWSDGRHKVRSPVYVFPHKHAM